jgi:integrase
LLAGGCRNSGRRAAEEDAGHSDIRTTMNIYGDVVTEEMTTAGSKIAALACVPEEAQVEGKDG